MCNWYYCCLTTCHMDFEAFVSNLNKRKPYVGSRDLTRSVTDERNSRSSKSNHESRVFERKVATGVAVRQCKKIYSRGDEGAG
jgi:hypothetical protein